MGTVWKSIFIATILFILLPISNKNVTARTTGQGIGKIQNVTGNMGGSTPTSSQPLANNSCGQVSPSQQIPKPERKRSHNLGTKKKTKKYRTRRRKSRKPPSVKKQNQKSETKCMSKEVVVTQTTNRNAEEHIVQFVEFRKKLHSFSPIEQMR